MEHLNGVCSPRVLVCPLRARRQAGETMSAAQHTPTPWAGGGIWSARSAQAGEHGGCLLPYTEIFPDHTVYCIADLAFTQIKRVYMLHSVSQTRGEDNSYPAVPEPAVNYFHHIERTRGSLQ